MIISGKLPITWQPEDFELCDYQKHPNPYRGLNAVNKNKIIESLNVSLYVCYNIPKTLTQNLQVLKIDNMSLQLQKYLPGDYLPFHSDTYITYKKFYIIPKDHVIVRIILFLHDQQPGQQLWIKDRMYTGKAGDYIGWVDDSIHMAANLSNTNRYNLQITGTLKKW